MIGRLDEVEVTAIPNVRLDDPPSAEQMTSGRGAHVAPHRFRYSDQVVSGGCDREGPCDRFPASVLHPSDSADGLPYQIDGIGHVI